MICMKPWSGPCRRSDDTGKSDRIPAILDQELAIMSLITGAIERCRKKVVKLLLCDNFDTEALRDSLKNVSS